MNIAAVKPFWRTVLGYVDDSEVALKDPLRLGRIQLSLLT